MKRVAAVIVTAVLLSLPGVQPARAEGSWFLPSTWVSVAAGQLEAVIGALSGGSVSVTTQASVEYGAGYTGSYAVWPAPRAYGAAQRHASQSPDPPHAELLRRALRED